MQPHPCQVAARNYRKHLKIFFSWLNYFPIAMALSLSRRRPTTGLAFIGDGISNRPWCLCLERFAFATFWTETIIIVQVTFFLPTSQSLPSCKSNTALSILKVPCMKLARNSTPGLAPDFNSTDGSFKWERWTQRSSAPRFCWSIAFVHPNSKQSLVHQPLEWRHPPANQFGFFLNDQSLDSLLER